MYVRRTCQSRCQITTLKDRYFMNLVLGDRQNIAQDLQADFQRAFGRRLYDRNLITRRLLRSYSHQLKSQSVSDIHNKSLPVAIT